MLTRIIFDTDKISESSIRALEDTIALKLKADTGTSWGDEIEIEDYLNPSQVMKLMDMLKPKMRAIDEIRINAR